MQEWKILGSNSLINNEHIDCSDNTKYSCRNLLKSMDYHVGGTPYIIQKQRSLYWAYQMMGLVQTT